MKFAIVNGFHVFSIQVTLRGHSRSFGYDVYHM